jgi:pimeloyl-ACP methyl ester carboxylesterase
VCRFGCRCDAAPAGEYRFSLYERNADDYLFAYEGQAYAQKEIGVWRLPAGAYTAVVTHAEITVSDSGRPGWLSWLVPVAHAYYPSAVEVQVIDFTITEAPPEPQGASSVLFLPGIQASRLYADGALGTENQLWEPNVNADVSKLKMSEDGESLHTVYTRDVIDKALGVVGVYDEFDAFLDGLVADEVIDDWQPFAYDWRYSVFDVVADGTVYGDTEGETERVYLQEVLADLASTSKSGKVTIVAHSNGGLLAKALMISLEEHNQTHLVDRIIFVGSPQLGTPKAVASILHGYSQEILGGWILGESLARDTILNLPGAYGLLPSQKYLDSVQDQLLVSFDDSDSTSAFRDAYGIAINTETELFNFLVGEEGRAEAVVIEEASRANISMTSEAFKYKRNQLDTWRAPETVDIIEVVGTGLETESGFHYKEFKERECSEPDVFGTMECSWVERYKPTPRVSVYGDGTVIGWSAEGYAGEKQTYYYDLYAEDEYQHSNLTESKSMQHLISNFLLSTSTAVAHISTTRPEYSEPVYLIGVHSPVAIRLTDADGRVTGRVGDKVLEDIPHSSYREIAGSKYVSVPVGGEYEVMVVGLSEGGYALTMEEIDQAGTQLLVKEIVQATSTAGMRAEFVCRLSNCGALHVDYEGDGVVDAVRDWEGGYEVIVPDSLEDEVDDGSKKSIVKKSKATGTKVRDAAAPKQVGMVAGVTTSWSAADRAKLYEVLWRLKQILDNWH